MLSQRSVQATFKSGTLKTFSNSQLETLHYINSKTYKHSVNGSKFSAWHVTRVSMDIKKENLIFWNSLKHCAVLKERHMRLSHRPSFRYAHHASWNSSIKIQTKIEISVLSVISKNDDALKISLTQHFIHWLFDGIMVGLSNPKNEMNAIQAMKE